MENDVLSIGRFSISLVRAQQIIIVLAVALLYGYSVNFDFVLDDKIVITDNQFVKNGFSGIGKILTTEGFEGFFGEKRDLVIGSRYRPLSLVMFAIEYGLVGLQPWLGHLMNILLYALLGLIVFGWSRSTFDRNGSRSDWLALPFLIGLLYILHPVHTEAVANIKGRDEILAMIFSMLTLWSGQRYADAKRVIQVILAGIFFFLAMMSKENSVTFLAVVPLTLWLLSKAGVREIWPVLMAMILAFAGYLALRYNAVGYVIPQAPTVTGDLMNNPFLEMQGTEKWSTIIYTLGKYIQLLLFPHPLTHDYYPYHIPIVGWGSGYVVATIATYAFLILMAVVNYRKRPWITWCVAFFLITMSIVSNIPFTVGTFMNERFLFMPSLAFIVAVSFGLRHILKGGSAFLGKIILVVLVTGYTVKTALRVPDWEDGPTLNQSAIKVSRNSARINTFVATDYYNQSLATNDRNEKMRLLTDAKKHLVRARNIYPLYMSANSMLSGVCAEFFKYDRDIDELLSCFQDVAAYRPDTEYLNQFLNYLKQNGDYTPELIRFYEETGYKRLYEERNNFPYAIRYLKEAEMLSPGSKSIYEKLSAVYLAFGYHLQDYPDPKYKVSDIIESGRYYGNKAMER